MKYGSEWEGERGPRHGWKGLEGPPAGPAFVLADTFTPAGHKGFGDTSRIHSPLRVSLAWPFLPCSTLPYALCALGSVVLCVITITTFVQPVLVECSGRVFVWLSRLLLLIFWGYGFVDRKIVGCVCFEYRKFQIRFFLFWNLCLCVKSFTFISFFSLLVISANI